MKRHGTKEARAAAFWARTRRVSGGCLEWIGGRDRKGYGLVSYRFDPFTGLPRQITMHAHRYAWLLTHGSLPLGLHILHRCDNPPCVDPAHLWPGTDRENQLDCYAKGRRKKTVCKQGHPYTSTNRNRHGQCRDCARVSSRNFYLRVTKPQRRAESSARKNERLTAHA